jgi:hypothetical protein
MRPRLTYANVVSTLCLFLVLGGGAAYGASQLGKNSVGPKQLKKNAVVTAKIKNEAITASKVKKGTLTGTQIDASTLGTVPTANSAQTAQTAQIANALSPSEPWREVGAPGEPTFLNKWANEPALPAEPSVAFYKDHDGIVHLQGYAVKGEGETIFELPAGFRPPNGKLLTFLVSCAGPGECVDGSGTLTISGSGLGKPGAVNSPINATSLYLNGITFRAES